MFRDDRVVCFGLFVGMVYIQFLADIITMANARPAFFVADDG